MEKKSKPRVAEKNELLNRLSATQLSVFLAKAQMFYTGITVTGVGGGIYFVLL